MSYRIIIEKLTPKEGSTYPNSEKIYEQIVEELSISELIRLINPEDQKNVN